MPVTRLYLWYGRCQTTLLFAAVSLAGCGHQPKVALDTIPLSFRGVVPGVIKNMRVGDKGYVFMSYCVDSEFHVRIDPDGIVWHTDYPNLKRESTGYLFIPIKWKKESPDTNCSFPVIARIAQ